MNRTILQSAKTEKLLKAGIWIAYLFFSFLFWYRYSYDYATDTLSYFNIARNYSNGYFMDALNACWSPLISWLLIPFMKLGVDEFYALRLINIFCGIICLIISGKLFRKLSGKKDFLVEVFFQITLSLVLLAYQVMSSMPDLLAATMALLYLYTLSFDKPNYALTGFVAALAYFAKAYNFIFFIASFSIYVLWEFLFRKKRALNNIKKYLSGFLTFFALTGIWISLLYVKYDRFLISSAAVYNTTVMQTDGSRKDFDWDKIIPPPNEHSTSGWDDPTYYKITPRNFFGSSEEFSTYLSILKINVSLLNHFMSCMSYFKIFWLILIPIFLLLLPIHRKELHFLLYVMALLYLMGYTLILIDERYLMFSYFIFILLTFSICSVLIQKYPRLKFAIILIPFVFIAKNGVLNIRNFYDSEDLRKKRHEAVVKLSSLPYFQNSNWVSDEGELDCYTLAYLSGSKYYGFFGRSDFKEALTDGVRVSDLHYYVSFGNRTLENTVLVEELSFYGKPFKLYRFVEKKIK